jgi:pimeloyl-ACP methyl ester carboxylesterase
VTLVGWSFGAQISLHVAATEPQRLARLALVGSNAVRASSSADFPFGADAEKALRSLVRAERLKRLDYRETVIRGGFATDPGDNTIGFLVRTQLQMPSWAAVACYESYLLTDLIDLVGQVRLPVLQIVGDSDATTPLEGAAWLQERLHDGQLTVLGECGHYPMLETPAAFREALLSFVSGRQSASSSA